MGDCLFKRQCRIWTDVKKLTNTESGAVNGTNVEINLVPKNISNGTKPESVFIPFYLL